MQLDEDEQLTISLLRSKDYWNCCTNLRALSRKVTNLFDNHLYVVGIRASQYILMNAIHKSPNSNLTELANYLSMCRTTLSRNIKPLIRCGFVEKNPIIDRRSKSYHLTEKGLSKVLAATPIWDEVQVTIVKFFESERYERLHSDLTRLTKIIEALLD